ncbi:MAG: lactonase family protein, partial [Verrucomicrobiota bacterium]|nr:lactonase family protein [Verrucomicrobiota bacterium]
SFGSPSGMLVYIGTYTNNGSSSQCIYALRFDPASGALSKPFLAAKANNPTFLALHPNKRYLYTAGEIVPTDPLAASETGGIAAYAIDANTGKLTYLDNQCTSGKATTHLAVDATGKAVVAVSYGNNYVCTLPIAADFGLDSCSVFLQHHGPLGPNHQRQDKPHPHSVTLSPDNRFAFVCDLGLDRVFSYRFDADHAAIEPNDPPFAVVPAGVGPRHSTFSRDGRFFYVVNEMGGSICVFDYDAASGRLTLKQTISTLRADYHGVNTSAEICIHPNGRFVYASNRGPDELAVFLRDEKTGLLKLVEIVPCGGKHPRNFELSPDGNWLLCANRDTNNVVVFRVDSATGRLTPTGQSAEISQPVCVLFVPH